MSQPWLAGEQSAAPELSTGAQAKPMGRVQEREGEDDLLREEAPMEPEGEDGGEAEDEELHMTMTEMAGASSPGRDKARWGQ